RIPDPGGDGRAGLGLLRARAPPVTAAAALRATGELGPLRVRLRRERVGVAPRPVELTHARPHALAAGLEGGEDRALVGRQPALLLIGLIIVFPLAYSFYLSLLNFDLAVGPDAEFIGLRNYTEALTRDQRFLESIWNTAAIIAPALVFELLLGLGIALLLNRV